MPFHRSNLSKDIFVAILEDDIFSRNWMALMMVRDWRTRVVGEFTTRTELCAFIEKAVQPIHVLIVDVDLFGEHFTISEISHTLMASGQKSKILLTGIQPDPKMFQQMDEKSVSGYVMKSEIGYSLNWVITFISDGYYVFTPSTKAMASHLNFNTPPTALVLDGRKTILNFTDHEAEVARMAFIFSMGRRDLADELKISEQWSYGLVSELYKKMGLADIIAGEVDLFTYIGDSVVIKNKFEEIIEQLGTSRKARDMETLAFHLLTMPEILE
jgi:hypothetical protein